MKITELAYTYIYRTSFIKLQGKQYSVIASNSSAKSDTDDHYIRSAVVTSGGSILNFLGCYDLDEQTGP